MIPRYFTQIWLDEKIPFIKEFIIPYLLWFLFVPYGMIYVGLHSRKDFIRLFLFLFGGMAVANLIFSVYPNAQGLRPTITSDDLFSFLVKLLYSIDTPTDVCPSMHVFNSIAVNTALQHSESFSAKKYRKEMASILTILICLSTVFLKQHAVFDGICGIGIAVLFYILLYKLPAYKQQKNGPKNQFIFATDNGLKAVDSIERIEYDHIDTRL